MHNLTQRHIAGAVDRRRREIKTARRIRPARPCRSAGRCGGGWSCALCHCGRCSAWRRLNRRRWRVRCGCGARNSRRRCYGWPELSRRVRLLKGRGGPRSHPVFGRGRRGIGKGCGQRDQCGEDNRTRAEVHGGDPPRKKNFFSRTILPRRSAFGVYSALKSTETFRPWNRLGWLLLYRQRNIQGEEDGKAGRTPVSIAAGDGVDRVPRSLVCRGGLSGPKQQGRCSADTERSVIHRRGAKA